MSGAPPEAGTSVGKIGAARLALRQYVLELPANGTSGPYALLGDGAIVNSEKVEIVTRDRNALGQVVRVESLQRFVDYEIEPFNRSLLFKAPVASFDANLNPRFIKVTYEVDQGGEPFWIAGLDALIKVNDSVSVGGLVQKDHNPLQPLSVYGLSMIAKTTEFSTVTAELAATDRHGVASLTGISGQGGAGRIVFKQDDPKNHTQITVSAAKTGIEFDNPTSSMPAGRVEIKGIAKQKINADHVLLAEGSDSDDLVQGNQRKNYALKLESQLAPQTRPPPAQPTRRRTSLRSRCPDAPAAAPRLPPPPRMRGPLRLREGQAWGYSRGAERAQMHAFASRHRDNQNLETP